MLGVSPATLRRWSVAGQDRDVHDARRAPPLRPLDPRAPPAGCRRTASSRSPSWAGRPTGWSRSCGTTSSAVCPDVSWLDGADQQTLAGARPRGPGHGRRRARLRRRCVPPGAGGRAGPGPAGRRAARAAVAERRGGNLGETVATFQRCRSLLLDLLGELACRHGLATPATTRMLARANDAGDRLVVALVLGARRGHPSRCTALRVTRRVPFPGRGLAAPASVIDRAVSAWSVTTSMRLVSSPARRSMICWSRLASTSRRSSSDSSALARPQRSRRYWCRPSDSIRLRSAHESSCSKGGLAGVGAAVGQRRPDRAAGRLGEPVDGAQVLGGAGTGLVEGVGGAARGPLLPVDRVDAAQHRLEVLTGRPGRLLQHAQGHARGVGDGQELGDAVQPDPVAVEAAGAAAWSCSRGRRAGGAFTGGRVGGRRSTTRDVTVRSSSRAPASLTGQRVVVRRSADDPQGARACAGQGTTSERARDSTRMVTETPRSRRAGPIIGSSASPTTTTTAVRPSGVPVPGASRHCADAAPGGGGCRGSSRPAPARSRCSAAPTPPPPGVGRVVEGVGRAEGRTVGDVEQPHPGQVGRGDGHGAGDEQHRDEGQPEDEQADRPVLVAPAARLVARSAAGAASRQPPEPVDRGQVARADRHRQRDDVAHERGHQRQRHPHRRGGLDPPVRAQARGCRRRRWSAGRSPRTQWSRKAIRAAAWRARRPRHRRRR